MLWQPCARMLGSLGILCVHVCHGGHEENCEKVALIHTKIVHEDKATCFGKCKDEFQQVCFTISKP